MVVVVDELRHDPLGLEVGVAVVVVAVPANRSVEELDDAVGFGVAGSRPDVEQVVRFDDGAQVGVAELAAVVVHDAELVSATGR